MSLAELTRTNLSETAIYRPQRPAQQTLERLLVFGGFPEPFLKFETRFSTRWKRLRGEQLVREHIRDLTWIQDIGQLEILMKSIAAQAGQLVNYTKLANRINASVDTIRRWLGVLQSFYFCFEVRPWSRNVTKSLRKQPKLYLWDWSLVAAEGGAFRKPGCLPSAEKRSLVGGSGFGRFRALFLAGQGRPRGGLSGH
ncbi:MAG: DUF4143 domain-containing protein [Desulfosudis oleivorans]|nr:DUF4143 domain-containing protein [Desulfosudis oleivorans]